MHWLIVANTCELFEGSDPKESAMAVTHEKKDKSVWVRHGI